MLGDRQIQGCSAPETTRSGIHYILFLRDMECTQSYLTSSSNSLLQQFLESLAVFRKLLDTLMKLVERHLFLQQCPPEFGLIVNE